MKVSLIWITRKSEQEDRYLEEYLQELRGLPCEKIIVGHVGQNLIGKHSFTYIPFHEFGLDDMGLICHKKNIGVLAATGDICVVMHADISIPKDILINYPWEEITSSDIVCPLAFMDNGARGLTWCRKFGQHKPENEEFDTNSYISGACLIARRHTLIKWKWNQNLKHNQSEDVDMTDRLASFGLNIYCEPHLRFKIKTTQ